MNPIKELEKLRTKTHKWNNIVLDKTNNLLSVLNDASIAMDKFILEFKKAQAGLGENYYTFFARSAQDGGLNFVVIFLFDYNGYHSAWGCRYSYLSAYFMPFLETEFTWK